MVEKCVEYLMLYEENFIGVDVEEDRVGDVTVVVLHPTFELWYTLTHDSLEEANVWLNAVKALISVKPESALYLLEGIFKKGKVLHEGPCEE